MNTLFAVIQQIFPSSCCDRLLLVGGTVRDLLLGREPHDLDLVSFLTHEELTLLGFRLVEATSSAPIYFKHHPAFGKIEITLLEYRDDLIHDLTRRDFTVNAIAMDCNGEIIDPLDGRPALETKTLIPCSVQSFTLDPIRIFRAFRFVAAGWCMSAHTMALIGEQEWSEELSAIPMERFSNEMLKALGTSEPERFFQTMLKFKVGKEFLPELFRMPYIPAGPLEHHPEGDLFTHCVQVLQRVSTHSSDPLTRFCAFFHDLGKLATDPALYPKHHGHDGAGFTMAIDFCNHLRLPATWRIALAWISSLHGKANLWESLRGVTKMKVAEQALKAGIVEILPLVAVADKAGGIPMAGWHETVRVAGMSSQELGIDPERLQKISPVKRADYIREKKVEIMGLIPVSNQRSHQGGKD